MSARMFKPVPPPTPDDLCPTCRGTGLTTHHPERPLPINEMKRWKGVHVWANFGLRGDRPAVVIGHTEGGRLRLVMTDTLSGYKGDVFVTRDWKNVRTRHAYEVTDTPGPAPHQPRPA